MHKKIFFGCIFILILCLGLSVFKWRLETKMSFLQAYLTEKYNISFNFDDYTLSWNKLRFKRVHIKGHLNFSSDFLDISLSLFSTRQFKVSATANNCVITKILQQTHKDSSDKFLIQSLSHRGKDLTLGIFSNIHLSHCQLGILNSQGQQIFSAALKNLGINLQNKSLTFQTEAIKYKDISILKNISGDVILNLNEQVFPFLITSTNNKGQHWQAKGKYNHNIKELELYFKNSGIQKEWLNILGQRINLSPDINYAMRLVMNYNHSKIFFKYFAATTNLQFSHEKIAEKPLGPLPVKLKIKGEFWPESGRLKVNSGEVKLLSKNNRSISLSLLFAMDNRNILLNKSLWRTRIYLPISPCNRVKKILPDPMLNQIKHFQIGGNVSLDMLLHFNFKALQNFEVKKFVAHFSCALSTDSKLFSSQLFKKRVFLKEFDRYLPTPQLYSLFSKYYTHKVTPYLSKAIIANEDNQFHQHSGVDGKALIAALRTNLEHKKFIVGASTITMQLVKNLYFSPQKTLSRKFQEILISRYLESILTKEEILNAYMNIVEFGPNIYGVGKAAKFFFNKSARDLSIRESTYLATILPNPSNAFTNYCRGYLDRESKKSIEKSLSRQRSLGYLTTNQWQQSLQEQIIFSRSLPLTQQCLITMSRKLNLGKIQFF